MDDIQVEFHIDPNEPVYTIGVVSRLVQLPIWTLRVLDREGVVTAKRSGKSRMYCFQDVCKLKYVGRLMVEEHVNLNGVKVILRREGWVLECDGGSQASGERGASET